MCRGVRLIFFFSLIIRLARLELPHCFATSSLAAGDLGLTSIRPPCSDRLLDRDRS